MSTKKDYKSNFQEVVDRLQIVSGKTKEQQIAVLLGFKKDTFAARKSRGSLPVKEIQIACASNGWSYDWVMSGEGEMFVVPQKQPQTVSGQLEGLSPEIKLIADYLEVKLRGKSAEERLKYIEEIMEEIRNKYK